MASINSSKKLVAAHKKEIESARTREYEYALSQAKFDKAVADSVKNHIVESWKEAGIDPVERLKALRFADRARQHIRDEKLLRGSQRYEV
jgi:hypothetical protein